MSIINLETVADEEGVYGIQISFENASGTAATPKTLSWTLADRYGNVINDRKDVQVNTPSSSVVIVLSGDDLVIVDPTKNTERRALQIEGTYDDLILGSDVPIKAEVRFSVLNQRDIVE